MTRILTAAIGLLSMVVAATVTLHPATTVASIGYEATAGYSQAHVLQPGSRGKVVEI